jgi:hypothetical protein
MLQLLSTHSYLKVKGANAVTQQQAHSTTQAVREAYSQQHQQRFTLSMLIVVQYSIISYCVVVMLTYDSTCEL